MRANVLTVSDDGSACLSDDDGNIVNFDAEGKPISVVSGYNAAIKKIYEYDSNGRLYRIFDERLKSGNSSIKIYFLFEYAEGKLASVTAYDNYTKKRDQRQFEYDGNILVGIRQTAYNSNGIKTLSKLIKSYHYNDNQLVAIVDEESLSAVKLTYDNDKISEVVSGVIVKGESISLGMGLRAGDIMAYSGLSAAAIGGEIIGGGAFVSKKSCAYSYLLQGDICYGARLTNEAGIKTIIYLDERHHIVSQFESKSESSLLTLKKETGVILKVSKDTYGSMFINGRNTVKIAGSVYNISLNNNNDPLNSLNISHYKSNENKYFDCSFWFRHFENYDRLKIKFEYLLLGESSYRSQYIWINGRANSAWQKVSATIALNRTSEGKYESKSVTDIRMTLYRAGDISVTGYEVSHLVFNPSPHVTTLVGNGSAHIAFENVGKVTISARDKTYTVTNNRTATDIYFTEGDILRSLMNKFKKQSRGEDDTCFDVVCNDGTKRLSNVKGITFSTGSQQYNLLASENPVISEMITSDGKIKVQQKYLFRAAEFAVESVNNYYENGTDGGSTANDRQTANSKTYNYHGQELSETDEYGVKTVYEYNEYGQTVSKRIIGSDSSMGQSADAEYTPEGGAVSSVISGHDYQTYGYNSPFGMLTDISNGRYNAAAGAYEQSGDKQTFEYGGYNDRVVKTSRYDSGTLSGSNEITYDNNGNILTKKVGNTTINYAYDGDKLVSYNGQACVYDAVGNPTTYRGKTVIWVRGRKLASFDGNTFTYDALGKRLSKNDIKFWYDSNGRLLKQSNGIEFFYDVVGVIAIKYNGVTYLCRKDILGNIIALIDSSGNTVVQYNYDAWGDHKVVDANGNEITDSTHIGNLNPFRYRGYYYDAETGLYFLQTRYYDPEVGRFLNMDSVRYADPKSVNGINLYAYCMNNPIKNTDPDGTFILGWIIAVVVAVCVAQTIADVVEVVEISKNENERIEVSEDGTNVKIVDSHKIKTPWMQLGYSIYLNHFKEETKDVIQGSSFGVQFEWQAHNLMYTIGKIIDNESIMNSAKSVDVGKTIFDDNHAEGFAGFGSSAMKFFYALTTNPIYSIYDLIVYNRR